MTVVPLAVFAALEGGLRLFGYGYPTQFFVPVDGRRGHPLAEGEGSYFETNQRYGWRFFPKALARTPLPRVLAASKAPGAYRIFILGESAAMGIPDPAYGFGRYLQVMLEEQYPGVRFEVVNTAMTAINSHVILPIAQECARHQPDLFVVYMGNNEFVGPFGPGSVFSGIASSRGVIRTQIAFRTTKIGQLLGDVLDAVSRPKAGMAEWNGMEMFLKNTVGPGDPRAERVYDNFRANLAGICAAGIHAQRVGGAGAKVIVCTVPVNLQDCAPFASSHRSGLTAEELSKWEEQYRAGVAHAEAGRHEEAIKNLLAALAIDDKFAELHFRLGRELAQLRDQRSEVGGQRSEAGPLTSDLRPPTPDHCFRLARDLDALRFRADTRINEAIRDVAAGREAEGVFLVDVEKAFEEQRSEIGDRTSDLRPPTSDRWFYEHVHLRPEGNYRLAEEVFSQVARLLPEEIRSRRRGEMPSPQRCAALLALTPWDRWRIEELMRLMQESPPFTNQCDFRLQQQQRANESAALWAAATSPASMEATGMCYREALARATEDVQIKLNYAEFLRHRGLAAAAAEQIQAAIERFPDVASYYDELGDVLMAQEKWDEAVAAFRDAARRNPAEEARSHLHVGCALIKQKAYPAAEVELRRALAINPQLAEADEMLGVCRFEQGQIAEAIKLFQEAIQRDPNQAETHRNLGAVFARQGRWAEAVDHFRAAERLDPRDYENYRKLAAAWERQGKPEKMLETWRRAAAVLPFHAETHYRLAAALQARGQIDAAVREYRAVFQSSPGWDDPACQPAAVNLAGLLNGLGQAGEAIELYRRVLEKQPDYVPALSNLASILATCPERAHRDAAEAIRLAERACQLTGSHDLIPLDALAAAYAEAGRFEAAARTEAAALEAARRQKAESAIPHMEHRLLTYRARSRQP